LRLDALTKLVAPNSEGWGGLFHRSVIQTAAKEFHPKFFIIVHIFGVFKMFIIEKFSLF
jgi:hypothetical protein